MLPRLARRLFSTAASAPFRHSPSDRPGFVLYDTVEQLIPPSSSSRKLPFLTPFQSWKQTQQRPELRDVATKRSLGNAIGQYENQERIDIVSAIRRTSKPPPAKYLEGAVNEALEVSEAIERAGPQILHNDTLLMSTGKDSGAIDTIEIDTDKLGIELMSIMKWRKRRMRGHKYQKRQRRNRYKTKL